MIILSRLRTLRDLEENAYRSSSAERVYNIVELNNLTSEYETESITAALHFLGLCIQPVERD